MGAAREMTLDEYVGCLAENQPNHCAVRELADLRTALAEAQRENEELREDRERLDWLLQNERIYQPYLMNEVEYSRKLFTREHIDAARRAETKHE